MHSTEVLCFLLKYWSDSADNPNHLEIRHILDEEDD
jgi:hypothetical protein